MNFLIGFKTHLTFKRIIILLLLLVFISSSSGLSILLYSQKNQAVSLQKQIAQLDSNVKGLKGQVKSVTSEYTSLQNTDENKKATDLQNQLDNINNAFTFYSSLQTQIQKAKSMGINVDNFNTQLSSISTLLFSQKFTDAITAENTLNTQVVNSEDQLIASQKKVTSTPIPATPTPTPKSNSQSLPGSSFNITTVKAQGTNYTVYYISIDLSNPKLKIITDTANSSDCSNNCPVHDLMTYYNNDKGFAAINGTYLCPASYSSCANQTNSFDFPVYNTNLQKWINQNNLSWVNRAMLTFDSSNNPTFYPDSTTYSGQSINSGFVMAPGLVSNGQVIVNNYPLDSKSSGEETYRGAVGIKGSTLIVADATSATVPQMAYIMQAMGATNAISLDGGGSTAMIYNGNYELGPGRQIPNAIVFSNN